MPRRTLTVPQSIINAYRSSSTALLKDVQSALGRVPFTVDVWQGYHGRFLAVTVHYYAQDGDHRLQLQSRLLIFCRLEVDNTAEPWARSFLQIIKEAGLDQKIGSITMKSDTTNDAQMVSLENIFADEGIHLAQDASQDCQACVAVLERDVAQLVHWLPEDTLQAREWIVDVMTAFATARRHHPPPLQQSPLPFLRSLVSSSRSSTPFPRVAPILLANAADGLVSSAERPAQPNEEFKVTEEEALQLDKINAAQELERYLDKRLLRDNELNPVIYWENQESRYPLLFKVALDVLPVQASVVSCKRLFFDKKERGAQQQLEDRLGMRKARYLQRESFDR
ncbi:hypothetical protein CERSUDRAFT_96327 [Gelatoporia subvermispora B]|uniref:HAT C-terminal dimerisation domain-containing protein n=1 Tax=Ceriporiopsis subvermispora (strain B) TaxID=914234 RepID=M2RBD8_CERS8|nr:hypothetical protein CERSUDRAFT_96327 [Gelatoporia subvermispora B]